MAELTHFDDDGAAQMVEIAGKPETLRHAVAAARVRMAAATLARIEAGTLAKGDVLAVARLAGIAATKVTAQTIPLCHPVRVVGVRVDFRSVPPADAPSGASPAAPAAQAELEIRVRVDAIDRTGPEMEAMHGATIAALTVYDMCKAIDRAMAIDEVVLLEKSGGKSGQWSRDATPGSITRP
ncbi:MAG: cyclic pyranopterin monophosphate synthase MoaC [Nannocystaceae bacterium]|nr:cyclic pyranopterin monophosphate synthase MoaC [Nannocystaceae bacterium]